jgi:hypothetical protein
MSGYRSVVSVTAAIGDDVKRDPKHRRRLSASVAQSPIRRPCRRRHPILGDSNVEGEGMLWTVIASPG